MSSNICEYCLYYEYDEQMDEWCCVMEQQMDEDELARLISGGGRQCPYYRPGDEYTIVHKQN